MKLLRCVAKWDLPGLMNCLHILKLYNILIVKPAFYHILWPCNLLVELWRLKLIKALF